MVHVVTCKKRSNPQILHKYVIFAQLYHPFLPSRRPLFFGFCFDMLHYSFATASLFLRSIERTGSERTTTQSPGTVKENPNKKDSEGGVMADS
jgi:hypothetical protein